MNAPSPGNSSKRLISVDALRGFDMFWIVGGDLLFRSFSKLGNNGLTRLFAEQMEHCEWDGFHFYDLIFPMFVFIVGVAIPFSITRLIEKEGQGKAVRRIAL